MFVVDSDNTIHLTRGDFAVIAVDASNEESAYTFAGGDIVRLTVYEKNKPKNVVLQKDVTALGETESVDIMLTQNDTKFGDYISKPVDYWYEIELNPDTTPQTLIGYDKDGPKIFKLYPEGGEVE